MSHRISQVAFFSLVLLGAVAPGAFAQNLDLSLDPVPYNLPDETLRNPQLFSVSDLSAQKPTVTLPTAFFAGVTAHPRFSLEYEARRRIESYQKDRKQYLRVELKDGRVLIGNLDYLIAEGFTLQTGAIRMQQVRYSDVSAVPQPVDAAGHKFVRGLEFAGLIAAAIVVVPIVLPVLAVACTTGACVD